MSPAADTPRVPGFALGTSSKQIIAFRDEHIPAPDAGKLDPQSLQAWAQLTRAAIAAEANELAVSLADPDADIEGVRAEVDRLGGNLFEISIDLALLFAQCEAVIALDLDAKPASDSALGKLKSTIEKLRKKFDMTPPPANLSANAAAAGAAGEVKTTAVDQPDGAGGQ